jgi:hypothetical protein
VEVHNPKVLLSESGALEISGSVFVNPAHAGKLGTPSLRFEVSGEEVKFQAVILADKPIQKKEEIQAPEPEVKPKAKRTRKAKK